MPLSLSAICSIEQNDLTNCVSSTSQIDIVSIFIRKMGFLLLHNVFVRRPSSGRDQTSTNCSIALEIVLCVPNNDLSSFSISSARSRNQFGVPFRSLGCFVRHRPTAAQEKKGKASLSFSNKLNF